MGSTTPTQDLQALVRNLLLENAALTTVVADRITGPWAPRSGEEPADTLFPSVVLEIAGGYSHPSRAIQRPLMYVYGYSRVSQADADRVLELARPLLSSARLARDGINTKGTIRELETPDGGYNPDLRAYFARCTYQIVATSLSST